MSSTLENLMQVNTRQLKEQLTHVFASKLVPFVRSSPGVGKSAVYRYIADMFNLVLVDIRLSMYEPQDFSGLPFRDEDMTIYAPTSLFPLDGRDQVPEGKDGWLILLDEFTHGSPEMMRATYKLILDRMVGERKLHDDAFVALAGNGIDDNALAGSVGTAINSRVTHLHLKTNTKVWIEDVAIPFNYDHRVIGFISANGNKLNDFDPEQDDHSFACERTWESISKIITSHKSDVKHLMPVIAGTISPGIAAEFVQFCAIYQSLIKVSDIIRDPASTNLPSDNAIRWAMTTQLADACNANNVDPICQYVDRMPVQYAIIFMKMILTKKELMSTDAVGNLLKKVGKLC